MKKGTPKKTPTASEMDKGHRAGMKKMGRPKTDPTDGAVTGAFWNKTRKKLKDELIARGLISREECDRYFSAPMFAFLKSIADNPATLNSPDTAERLRQEIMRHPIVVPYAIARIGEESMAIPELDRFVFHYSPLRRDLVSNKVMAEVYHKLTGKNVSEEQIRQSLQNVYRRIRAGGAA